jgi:hypothetical protein
MTKKPKRQSDLFIEKAREIGADDDADTTHVMRQLARQPKTERKPVKAKKAATK